MNKLKIGIITYNRSEQLKRAIDSCFENGIDNTLDIIVWDNNSSPQISKKNREICTNAGVQYFYSHRNLGVAGGRNKIWELCNSKYIFFLDDDALVSSKNFFEDIVKYMDSNPIVGAASVNIDEPSTGVNHNSKERKIKDNKIVTLAFIGGAHILRRDSYPMKKLYPNNLMFGSEELYASLVYWQEGYEIHEISGLNVIHQPVKQIVSYGKERDLCIIVNSYIVKKMLYPKYMKSILKCLYYFRLYNNNIDISAAKKVLKSRENGKHYYNVNLKTIIYLIKLFGIMPII